MPKVEVQPLDTSVRRGRRFFRDVGDASRKSGVPQKVQMGWRPRTLIRVGALGDGMHAQGSFLTPRGPVRPSIGCGVGRYSIGWPIYVQYHVVWVRLIA